MYKLLIADDEAVEREAVQFFIKNKGLEFSAIREAENGLKAVEIAKEFEPDIAILDIRMPGKDGLEAAREIQKSGQSCRFIFLTAFNEFDYAHQAIKVKAEDFIIKPANGDVLIGALRKVIEDIESEKASADKSKALEARAQLFTSWFENDLMLSVAKGYLPESRLRDYFERMDIIFDEAACAIIDIHQSTRQGNAKYDEKSMMRGVIGVIDRLCDENNVGRLIGVSGNRIYMIVMTNDGGSRDIQCQKFFGRVGAKIKGKMNVDIQIGIGKIFDCATEASNSFFQAKFACRGVKPLDGVVDFAHIEKHGVNVKYPINEEKKLLKSIIRGDEKSAEEYIETLMDWISQFAGSLERIKGRVYELIAIVDRAVIKEYSVKTVLIQRRYTELGNLGSMNEIIVFFKNIVSEIIIRINGFKKRPSIQLIEKACSYIDLNYNKDIKLEEVSDMLGFSKFYFSKLFKQYKNMNFVDYVTLRRLEKAKELLSNLRMSVKEISAETGYKDPNYFTYVFKTHEGISPTEYRSKQLGSGKCTKHQVWMQRRQL